jgi:hypothetical protein
MARCGEDYKVRGRHGSVTTRSVGEVKRRLDFSGCNSRPERQHGYRFRDGKGGPSFESEARLLHYFGSKLRTVATVGTTGYARAFGRVFDSQPRCRLR